MSDIVRRNCDEEVEKVMVRNNVCLLRMCLAGIQEHTHTHVYAKGTGKADVNNLI